MSVSFGTLVYGVKLKSSAKSLTQYKFIFIILSNSNKWSTLWNSFVWLQFDCRSLSRIVLLKTTKNVLSSRLIALFVWNSNYVPSNSRVLHSHACEMEFFYLYWPHVKNATEILNTMNTFLISKIHDVFGYRICKKPWALDCFLQEKQIIMIMMITTIIIIILNNNDRDNSQ